MKKIQIVNYYNSTNLGDNLITEYIESLVPEGYSINRYSYGMHDLSFRYVYNDSNIEIEKKIKNQLKKSSIVVRLNTLRNYLKYTRKKQWTKYRKDLIEAECLLIGGGNAIFDTNEYTKSYLFFRKHLKEAKKNNIPIFITSIGIGPFLTKLQEKKAVETLMMANYITFRDKKSMEIYLKYAKDDTNISLNYDPVFSMFTEFQKKLSNEKTIGINIMDLNLSKTPTDQIENYITSINNLIEKLTAKNYEVKLYSTEVGDYKFIKENFRTRKNTSIVYIKTVKELESLYSELNLNLTTRMHAAIISFSSGIPVIPMIWQPKVREMCELTSTHERLELEELPSYKDILNQVEKVEYNYEDIQQRMKRVHFDINSKVRENEKILKSLLNEK